jgi:hypothetical protein
MSDDALMRWEWEGGSSTSVRKEPKPAARVRVDKAAADLPRDIRAEKPGSPRSRDDEPER